MSPSTTPIPLTSTCAYLFFRLDFSVLIHAHFKVPPPLPQALLLFYFCPKTSLESLRFLFVKIRELLLLLHRFWDYPRMLHELVWVLQKENGIPLQMLGYILVDTVRTSNLRKSLLLSPNPRKRGAVERIPSLESPCFDPWYLSYLSKGLKNFN